MRRVQKAWICGLLVMALAASSMGCAVTVQAFDDILVPDTNMPDMSALDANVSDADTPDAGAPDAVTFDAETPNTETPNTEMPDAEMSDAGTLDAGTPDAEMPDMDMPDAGTPDAGAPNDGTPDGSISDPVDGDEPEQPEPAAFRYTILVRDSASGAPLADALVRLYQDGAAIDTKHTDTSGRSAWILPAGGNYSAKASKAGFDPARNDSRIVNLQEDVSCGISLWPVEMKPTTEPEPEPTPDSATEPDPTTEPEPMPESEPTAMPASVVIEVENSDGEAVQSERPLPGDAVQAQKIEIGLFVTITAPEATVTAGDPTFDVLNGVTAADQDGNAVVVYVLDLGGFDVNVSGVYTIKYAAMQGGDEIAVSRKVTVAAATEEVLPEDLLEDPVPQIDPSSERYRQRLRQKDRIQARLLAETEQIQEQLRATVFALTNGEQVRYLRVENVQGPACDSAFAVNAKRYRQVELAEVLNWGDLLACFAAQCGISIQRPFDLLALGDVSFDGLTETVASAVSITLQTGSDGTDVLIDTLPTSELALACGLNAEQAALFDRLLQPEYQRVLAALMHNTSYNDLTADEAAVILAALPEGISGERKRVILEAQSLLGQIQYLWGGKYNRVGWNPNWGLSANGESGLDCSGFVSWAFINAYQNEAVLADIGNGSSNQWGRSTHVDWEDAQVGDLAFIAVPGTREVNHIGIIAAIEPDGTYLVIHCASSKRGVVLTEAWASGFRFIRRPNIYGI